MLHFAPQFFRVHVCPLMSKIRSVLSDDSNNKNTYLFFQKDCIRPPIMRRANLVLKYSFKTQEASLKIVKQKPFSDGSGISKVIHFTINHA